MSERRGSRVAFLVAVAVSALWACDNAADIELIEVSEQGLLFGVAFVDLNGNNIVDPSDLPLRGVSVELRSGSQVVRDTVTDSLGVWLIPGVPLGTYTLGVAATVLSDSLESVGSMSPITVEVGDTLLVNLGTTYPTLTLAEVRAAPSGRRVFTKGIALNQRLSFGDGVVHVQDDTVYLRARNVAFLGSLTPGDSVRFLGRTRTDFGQPILDSVSPVVLFDNAAFLVARPVSVANADNAGPVGLDAALVRVGPAEIGDTTRLGGHLAFWAHVGGDSLQVLLRDYLTISPNPAIRPDTIVRIGQVTGLLRPYQDGADVRWRLLPRSGGDVVTQLKTVNMVVSTSFSQPTANVNDTVDVVVTIENAAPGTGTHVTATNVQVADTISARLSFLSASTTSGAYDAVGGLWSVGNIGPGSADTLRITVRVDGPSGTAGNTARLVPLVLEQENTPGNNLATTGLVIP